MSREEIHHVVCMLHLSRDALRLAINRPDAPHLGDAIEGAMHAALLALNAAVVGAEQLERR